MGTVLLGDCLLNGSPCAIGPLSVSPICPVLSVMVVICGQTVGWIKTPLGTEVGLGPGLIMLDGDQAPPKRGTFPQFSAHFCCGQTAGWIKMPLGREAGLS